MVWSFVKITAFIAIVAALALGAGYLAETGSGLRITIANMEESSSTMLPADGEPTKPVKGKRNR